MGCRVCRKAPARKKISTERRSTRGRQPRVHLSAPVRLKRHQFGPIGNSLDSSRGLSSLGGRSCVP